MIKVKAFARLHLGLLDHNGQQGRLYGSIGLSVNQPRLILRAAKADGLHVDGAERDRITAYAQRFIERYGVPKGARLSLAENIPAHVGLGSGTQLGLAVGRALAQMAGLQLSVGEIALAVERGMHSGSGLPHFSMAVSCWTEGIAFCCIRPPRLGCDRHGRWKKDVCHRCCSAILYLGTGISWW